MRLQSLQYFEKLIELKNYSNVAEAFHVYKSTISREIKRLENEAGCRLVVHNPKPNELILTSAGEKMHKYSKIIVDQLSILNNETKECQKRLKINLGMPPMINNTYFPKVAVHLNDKTLINLNIVDDNSVELIKMLKRGDLNITILASIEPIN
ncbi:hypothetical protein BGL34_04210 [Fructilactobacillus lindneri]|uniref:HTH lysR-type domain-containing protein n=2 Tax=Fructilactobacillus lindneri TaxID=53444 RepID=A0A0R2JMJ3_9LACO|nr:LysR family transcriptional regulator [Fructilactobacillus lindneri]ANZ57680.1 hypothetical protein AYR60_02330 [Fructilactobacillus lindneri]ANZ58950.1 hypothetical protein AYR59_02330 [Fructilactobacillus lindneri]KRN78416.1 hypothetical protein IV52_GL001186 [Fructilactobacillus lindneri DSM 20690 = JCM 11027]POG97975.1 hypothetical protein BGL31_04545 [Fructilactobacillus lindneri]POG99029.1 hypothetical protein BGL32_06260 [Fructilactobacillus lindneri]